MRRLLASLIVVVTLGSVVQAQTPVRLRWTVGQVLVYRMEHATEATDVAPESQSTTKSLLKVTKRWQVTHVDAAGVATLQMSLTSMVQERTSPSGDVLKFDSANPDKSTPELQKALAGYLNTPLATIRIDAFGKVVEVKSAKADASSFENELPFFVTLPVNGIKANDGWERAFKITLPPPLGTGEKYDAVQKVRVKAVTAEAATVTLTTELKTPPKAEGDAVPLWQLLPEGEVVFDVKNGRMHAAKLVINKELKNHQGENTSCKFASTLTIQYAGDR